MNTQTESKTKPLTDEQLRLEDSKEFLKAMIKGISIIGGMLLWVIIF